MLEAKIKFFDIKKCGFYLRGNPESEFSGLSDILQKLNSWATNGREFVNTTTYESNPDNDLLNTYFCNWHRNEINDDSILILWNEIMNDNGVLYGINPMDRPGATDMLTTGFGDTPAIPGFPSYFWFIPERNVFASIKFSHSIQGKKNLDFFLNGFLDNKSPFRVLDAEEKVVGFSQDGRPTNTSSRVHSKFLAIGRKQDELEQELLANLNKIRRIIKRETLKYEVADDRSTIERVFSGLLGNTPEFTQYRTITHELQFEPTEQQLRQIVTNFTNLNQNSSIKNVGFIYNDGKTIMLNGASVAFSTEIDIERDDNQILTPQVLLAAITQQRSGLLRALDNPGFDVEEAIAQ